jgi:predicted RNA-binding Zn ribbon-like protein
METQTFDFEAGALCLDFANTVDWHASDHPQDRLHDYFDLIAWAEAAALLPPDQADYLRQMAEEKPQQAETIFARAIRLRGAIYRLFVDVSEQGTFHDEDLALLNEALSESLAHLQLVPSAAGFDWDWAKEMLGFDHILWPVARSAGELLASDKLERVSQCADDRGCGYLFVDTSRNRSRRWCSMESCGNRAKAQRHYHRQQEGQ